LASTLGSDNDVARDAALTALDRLGPGAKGAVESLTQALKGKEGIQAFPAPQVYVHQLNNSSVDLRVLFWAADINQWIDLKSVVLSDIYSSLNREGIPIPFPQTDLHIRSIDPEAAAALRGVAGADPRK